MDINKGELLEQIETSEKIIQFKNEQIHILVDRNEKLKAENEKLRECVEFYANETTDIIAVRARKTIEEVEGEKCF